MKRIAKVVSFLLLFSLSASAQIDSIVNAVGRVVGWNVLTNSSVCQLMLNDKGEVLPGFYGHRAHAERLVPQDQSRGNGPFPLHEIPVRGKYADMIPLVEVAFADGTHDCELVFEKAEVVTVENRKTLHCRIQKHPAPHSAGNLYRLLSPFEGNNVSLQYIFKQGADAVVICYNLDKTMEGATEESRSGKQLRCRA